jgi:hypothetical protein
VLQQFDYDDKDPAVATPPDPLIVGPASRLFENGEHQSRAFPWA